MNGEDEESTNQLLDNKQITNVISDNESTRLMLVNDVENSLADNMGDKTTNSTLSSTSSDIIDKKLKIESSQPPSLVDEQQQQLEVRFVNNLFLVCFVLNYYYNSV